VLDLNREYVNETLVDVISSYGLPRKFVAAEGIRLWDDRGREYLDFLCSYGALGLGHNNPDVIKAVEMARRPPNFFVIAPGALTGALASNLAAIAPGDLERSFFCNSGSEAIEGAMKLARAATGRKRFIAAEEGFHGKSLGALSATGKAAVLLCRLTWNHPLIDGSKRAGWAALVLFADLNGGRWDPDPPNIHEAEAAMFSIASGDIDETWAADWLRQRIRFGPID